MFSWLIKSWGFWDWYCSQIMACSSCLGKKKKNVERKKKKRCWVEHVYFSWVESYHTFFATKVSEFSEARSFSYPELVNDSLDFSGLIWDRLQHWAKKQAEAASVIYNFVCVIFFHTLYRDYGLSREVCKTQLHENKTKRNIRGDTISCFQLSKVRSAASDNLWILENIRLAILLTWEKADWVFCISLMEKKGS